MRVLVTGADGYIGAILAGVLDQRGHDVVGLDAGFFRDAMLYPAEGQVPVRQQDTRTLSEHDLAGFEAVVHLAELSNDPLGQRDPALTYRINHQASVALAEASRRAGVARFVYSSSCSVYGAGTGDIKTEQSSPNPQTTYAECKVLVEQALTKLAADNFTVTCLRNATAYGPSPRMRFDIVLNNLAGCAHTTGEIRMTSDGTPWRPLVHVRDISEAMACTLEAPREAVNGEIFNVGTSDQNYQVRDIALIVAEAFPSCTLSFGSSDGDSRSYRVAFDKIAAHLPAFKCRYDAQDGAQQLQALFAQIGLTRAMFDATPYTRLKHLEYLMNSQRLDANLFWR